MNFKDNKVESVWNWLITEITAIYEEREAEVIAAMVMEHLFSYRKTDKVIKGQDELSESDILRVNKCMLRLRKHEPIQYVLGETHFYDRVFKVGPGVLIPRPETEELVDLIVNDWKGEYNIRVLDVGAGSGCIGLSLAAALKAQVDLLEKEPTALTFLNHNANQITSDARVINEDVFKLASANLRSGYEIIVSNPPYIPQREQIEMAAHVKDYEPESALFVPNHDPLVFYREVAELAKSRLSGNGKVYLELHHPTATETRDLYVEMGFVNIILKKDLFGKERMLVAELPS